MPNIMQEFWTMLKIWLLAWLAIASLVLMLDYMRPVHNGVDDFTDMGVGCVDDCLDLMEAKP